MNLARQARTGVGRSSVVVVVVEIHRRVDQAKAASAGWIPSYWSDFDRIVQHVGVVESQVAGLIRVAELDVIEDIEELHTKLHLNALS